MGSGIANRLSAVRWGVAGNIVTTWILTLPAAAALAALAYGITVVAGGGALGPVLISLVALVLAAAALVRGSRRNGPPVDG